MEAESWRDRSPGVTGEIDVADSLREGILRGEYVAGQRLVETDLCEHFGTTRFIIRSALQSLSAQGLVEMRRNRGARVRTVTIEEAIEITEVRRELEGLGAALAATRCTKAHATSLRAIVSAMRASVKAGELVSYSDLNAELHGEVRRIAAHETSARILVALRGQMVRHQFSLSLVPGRPNVSLPQHEAIARAIIARDADAARAAMHDHIESVIQALRALPNNRRIPKEP